MKYVGITGGDLASRWEQHRADNKSAVYKALRTEGHRMTMELLEEVDTKPEALKKEQEYIQFLGAATPNGWNRQVSTPEVTPEVTPDVTPKKWVRCAPYQPIFTGMGLGGIFFRSLLACPHCLYDYTHQEKVEVFIRDDVDGIKTTINHQITTVSKDDMETNPSTRRDGIRIYYSCESCHSYDEGYGSGSNPPLYELLIYQHKGQTFCETVYYIEDESL
jgi:hypothetical protein